MNTIRHRILVTGASGQLGMAIQELRSDYSAVDFIFASKDDLDITNQDSVINYLHSNEVDTIINTAAYTAVDKAENDKEAAFLINEKGVEYLAVASKAKGIKLIHISTDYVFDGSASMPYKEVDEVNPQTVYGKSKLAGEQILQKIAPSQYCIIRTSWLYSKKGHNFYNTMLRLAKENKEISVVNDQWGSPTNATELAKVLIKIGLLSSTAHNGIFHYSGVGACTWYAFAKAILEKYYPNKHTLYAVDSSSYPTAAPRPVYSVLDTTLIEKTFDITIVNWMSVI